MSIPAQAVASDAIFLLLRRMRLPLVVLVVVFTVSVFGLAAVPGTDAQGTPHRLSVFEAFYVMSYTATTIGFGEIPYAFSTCLLYTSDAADERSSVDLGGRRIIKKKIT